MTKRCLRCRGQKKVNGLGWMESDCPVCGGVGLVPNDDIAEPLLESTTESLDKLDNFRDRAPIQVPAERMNRKRGKK